MKDKNGLNKLFVSVPLGILMCFAVLVITGQLNAQPPLFVSPRADTERAASQAVAPTPTPSDTYMLREQTSRSVSAAPSLPKILISINQITAAEALQASKLRADGMVGIVDNSPDMNLSLYRALRQDIGGDTFMSEDGAISPGYLMNDTVTTKVRLKDSAGFYVSARGSFLTANVAESDKGSNEIFRYFYSQAPNPLPVTPGLLAPLPSGKEYFIQSYQRNWWHADGGGGSTISATDATGTQPSYWDTFRLHKLTPGDGYIRPFDNVAIQPWNGIFTGGNFVSADWDGKLIANSSVVGPRETFRITFPCEYVTGSYVAKVTHCMVYHEFSDEAPGYRDWTLNDSRINDIANRVSGSKVVVLTRSFIDLSEFPDKLPTHKQQVLNAIKNPNCGGVVFEVTAGDDLSREKIIQGINAVCKAGKACFVLAPPPEVCTNYSDSIKRTLAQLKTSPNYGKLYIVLACYDRKKTNVNFLGGSNSVQGALTWLKAHR